MSDSPTAARPENQLWWLLTSVLLSIIAALLAGILVRSTGVGLAGATLSGAAAFATALTLCMTITATMRH